MKKLFCIMTVMCLLASLVAVGSMSAAATKEQDEQMLVGGEPTATTPAAKTPQFRVVPAKVRPFTTPDKYVDVDSYMSIRMSYTLWFFKDERGEERYLFAKVATPREEVSYWLPGKNPDYSTIDYTDEQWYQHIVFETPGKTVVGLPADAEAVEYWYWFGDKKWSEEYASEKYWPEVREMVSNGVEAIIARQNNEDSEFGGLVSGAFLVNPYVELGGFYDLDNDGVAEEVGWDENGDGITEIVAGGVDPTATYIVYAPGDANDDGAVNMKDVLVLRKIIADIAVEYNEMNADVNGDGEINMKDVLTLRKYLAGIITCL